MEDGPPLIFLIVFGFIASCVVVMFILLFVFLIRGSGSARPPLGPRRYGNGFAYDPLLDPANPLSPLNPMNATSPLHTQQQSIIPSAPMPTDSGTSAPPTGGGDTGGTWSTGSGFDTSSSAPSSSDSGTWSAGGGFDSSSGGSISSGGDTGGGGSSSGT